MATIGFQTQLQGSVVVDMAQLCSLATPVLLKETMDQKIGGRCISAGYVERGSIDVVSYSSGCLVSGKIEFDVLYSCRLVNPSVGSILTCQVENVTKVGGIHCKYFINAVDYALEIFIVREEQDKEIDVQVGDKISVELTEIRFELGDITITAIGKFRVDSETDMEMDDILKVLDQDDQDDQDQDDDDQDQEDDDDQDDEQDEMLVDDDDESDDGEI